MIMPVLMILSTVGFIFIRPIAAFLGAEGALLDNCIRYAKIILAVLPFSVLQVMFQSFFVAAEKPQLSLIVTVSSGVTNIILDAVLVMLLPQEYKLAGAAIATAAAQTVGGAVPLFYFFRKNSSLLRLGKTTYDGKLAAEIIDRMKAAVVTDFLQSKRCFVQKSMCSLKAIWYQCIDR